MWVLRVWVPIITIIVAKSEQEKIKRGGGVGGKNSRKKIEKKNTESS